jgi:hypothetical protein
MMWVLQSEFQIMVWISREPCKYCISGFCSMMNFFIIMNSFVLGIHPTPLLKLIILILSIVKLNIHILQLIIISFFNHFIIYLPIYNK